MTTQEKIQFNSKCAAFLGAIPEQWYPPNKDTGRSGIHWVFPHNTWYPDNVRQHSDDLMKFNSDWNWIMEIYKKINSVRITAPMNGIQDSIVPYIEHRRPVIKSIINSNKEEFVVAVNSFIDWYNQNK